MITSAVIPSQLVKAPRLVSSILTTKHTPTAVSTSWVCVIAATPLASSRGPGYHSSLSTYSPRIGPNAAPLPVEQQFRLDPAQHRREQLLGEGVDVAGRARSPACLARCRRRGGCWCGGGLDGHRTGSGGLWTCCRPGGGCPDRLVVGRCLDRDRRGCGRCQ